MGKNGKWYEIAYLPLPFDVESKEVMCDLVIPHCYSVGLCDAAMIIPNGKILIITLTSQ